MGLQEALGQVETLAGAYRRQGSAGSADLLAPVRVPEFAKSTRHALLSTRIVMGTADRKVRPEETPVRCSVRPSAIMTRRMIGFSPARDVAAQYRGGATTT